MELLYLTAQC